MLFVPAMWRDFNEHVEQPISYELYRRVFDEQNIAFGQPSQDDCDACITYKRHSNEKLENHLDDCELCLQSRQHLERAVKARHEYQNIDSEYTAYAVDMQKVILLPKLSIKEHYFVSRLVVFNETFACLSKGGKNLVVLWHEALSGRCASDVASAYIKAIEISNSEKVLFWADNCCSQNKNWCLFTALCTCVNAEWGPSEVKIKYLERGHTYLKADSIHGCIGKKMKKLSEIVTFSDFVELCSKSSKSIKPVMLETADFIAFTQGQRTRKTKKATLPLLSSICKVQFQKGCRSLFYKTDFESEEVEVDFLMPKFDHTTFPPRKAEPRGIPSTKKDGILKLLHSVPRAKKKFWLDLPVHESVKDLTCNVE